MSMVSHIRRGCKNWWHYEQLLEMQLEGRGEDRIMFVYPDAPYHIEKRSVPVIYDELTGRGLMEWETIEEKVYDYPVLTVNEAINNFRAGRQFWDTLKA